MDNISKQFKTIIATTIIYTYRLATILGYPIFILWLYSRKLKGKEDTARFKERFGFPSQPRPDGSLIWIHGASMGESLSVFPLLSVLHEHYPNIKILFTTGTIAAATMLKEKLPAHVTLQYFPVDSWISTQRFLKYWNPQLIFWIESELWPNHILGTQNQCPMILLNARISPHSYQQWSKISSVSKMILSRFALIFPWSEHDAKRIAALGGKNIHVLGNLKFASKPLEADPTSLQLLDHMIGSRPRWIAASTHEGEEEQFAEIHSALKQSIPNVLTIIAPRHAIRGDDIYHLLTSNGLHVAQRSKHALIQPNTDIYLADTMGELGLFYRLAPIAFIGGSLIPHGGQNPIEPARLGTALIFGPHMHNFTEICDELQDANACITVNSKEEAIEKLRKLFEDHYHLTQMANAAKEVVDKKDEMLTKILHYCEPYLSSL